MISVSSSQTGTNNALQDQSLPLTYCLRSTKTHLSSYLKSKYSQESTNPSRYPVLLSNKNSLSHLNTRNQPKKRMANHYSNCACKNLTKNLYFDARQNQNSPLIEGALHYHLSSRSNLASPFIPMSSSRNASVSRPKELNPSMRVPPFINESISNASSASSSNDLSENRNFTTCQNYSVGSSTSSSGNHHYTFHQNISPSISCKNDPTSHPNSAKQSPFLKGSSENFVKSLTNSSSSLDFAHQSTDDTKKTLLNSACLRSCPRDHHNDPRSFPNLSPQQFSYKFDSSLLSSENIQSKQKNQALMSHALDFRSKLLHMSVFNLQKSSVTDTKLQPGPDPLMSISPKRQPAIYYTNNQTSSPTSKNKKIGGTSSHPASMKEPHRISRHSLGFHNDQQFLSLANKIHLNAPSMKNIHLHTPFMNKMHVHAPFMKNIHLHNPFMNKIHVHDQNMKNIHLHTPFMNKIQHTPVHQNSQASSLAQGLTSTSLAARKDSTRSPSISTNVNACNKTPSLSNGDSRNTSTQSLQIPSLQKASQSYLTYFV